MKKKVLFIEDDAIFRKKLVALLEVEGFSVISITDGICGAEIIKKEKIAVIILDMVSPKKDGYEAIRVIKKQKKAENIPIILLTDVKKISDMEKAMSLGATTYLVKEDYAPAEIIERIKDILRAKEMYEN